MILSEKLRHQAERLSEAAKAVEQIEKAQESLDKALESFPRFDKKPANGRGLNCLLPTVDGVANFKES